MANTASNLLGVLPAAQLSGTVPLAHLSGLTGSQFDAATWQMATNLNGGYAALASNVVSGISNQWRLDAANAASAATNGYAATVTNIANSYRSDSFTIMQLPDEQAVDEDPSTGRCSPILCNGY